jgi:DNA polymerase III subunit delta'
LDGTAPEDPEFLKSYLGYCQHMIRSCFVYKYGNPSLLRLNDEEKAFVEKFSAALTSENIPEIVQLMNQSAMHLERNADLKITFLNLSLYIGRLLNKQKAA